MAANDSMSLGRRSSLMSGCRRMTPVDEQGASTSTRSKGAPDSEGVDVRSAVTRMASRPARCRFSRTRARRSASSSTATRSASPGVRCAMCKVLPPGAAQASSTRIPGARIQQRRGQLRAGILHRSRAGIEPRQRLHGSRALEHQRVGIPVADAGVATHGPPGAQEVLGVQLRRIHAQHHGRMQVVSGQYLPGKSAPGCFQRLHQPARMCMPLRGIGVGSGQQFLRARRRNGATPR